MKRVFTFILIVGSSILAVIAMIFASGKKTAAKKKFDGIIKKSKEEIKATKVKTLKVESETKATKEKLSLEKLKTKRVKSKKKSTKKAKATAKDFKSKYKTKK